MTTADYAAAQLPAAPSILGAALPPLCLGHALMLERLGSPFSWEGIRSQESGVNPPGLGDLLLALEVCRGEPLALPARQTLDRLAKRHRKLDEAGLQAACLALEIHVLSAFQAPKPWREKDGADRDSGVPLLPGLKIGLMARLHRTEAEALNTPVRLALHDLASLSAIEGHLELISGRDEEMMRLASATDDTDDTDKKSPSVPSVKSVAASPIPQTLNPRP